MTSLNVFCRFRHRKTKRPLYNVKTGIKSTLKHILPFQVNHSIIIYGFGIFGPIIPKRLEIEYGVLTDEICNLTNQKYHISKMRKIINFTGHRDIYKIYFNKAIMIHKYQKYYLYLNVSNYLTYCGYKGRESCRNGDLQITFLNDLDCISLTTIPQGNIPEIYYRIVHTENINENNLNKCEKWQRCAKIYPNLKNSINMDKCCCTGETKQNISEIFENSRHSRYSYYQIRGSRTHKKDDKVKKSKNATAKENVSKKDNCKKCGKALYKGLILNAKTDICKNSNKS